MITPKGTLLCSALENTNLVSVEMTANFRVNFKRYFRKGSSNSTNEFIDSIKQYIKQMINSDNKLLKLRAMTKIEKAIEQSTICNCPKCSNGRIKKLLRNKTLLCM